MEDEEVEKINLANPFMKYGFEGEDMWMVKIRGQDQKKLWFLCKPKTIKLLFFFFFLKNHDRKQRNIVGYLGV